jgi:nucleolar protein 58
VKLHAFKKFKDTQEAVKSLGEFLEGNMPKDLKSFLKKNIISKEISEKLLCK